MVLPQHQVIKPLQTDGYYPFYLVAPSVTDTAFWDYWAAKGVTSSALGTWQEVMWYILHGVTGCPMFYLKASGGNYMLVDGLQKLTMSVDNPLRLNGDYPLGSYTFIAMPDAGPLAGITMTIMFR